MTTAHQPVKEQIWNNLKIHFDKFKNANNQMNTNQLDSFICQALKETEQDERDYVGKNLFRLDVDGSGTVSFVELGNFLFKRHCAEISLQKHHKVGKMKYGAERKMTHEEFNLLLNKAYHFLSVTFGNNVSQALFNAVDTDQDGFITYVQYFTVISKFLCHDANYKISKSEEKPKAEPEAPIVLLGPERHSKLRKYIWNFLRKLYEAYVQGRCINASSEEVSCLLIAILGDLSASELQFMTSGLLEHQWKTLQFEPFCMYFIFLVANLGLSRYAQNQSSSKRRLNCEQFIKLLKNSFAFVKLGNFKNSILAKIFAKIDKDCDGYITFDEYIDWVKRFLAVLKYYGDQFYVLEDDDDLDSSDPFEKSPVDVSPPKQLVAFVFSDYTFAKQVRARMWELLITFDADKNYEFSQDQIKCALSTILREDPVQLHYVVKNVFRYDKDNNQKVTYDQLTNFCVEWHFGELQIQRLHKVNFYKLGPKRMMDKQEFGLTINKILEDLKLTASSAIIDLLFSQIDLDKDGLISYEVYFLFLRYYFGGASLASLNDINLPGGDCLDSKPALSKDQMFLKKYDNLNPFDRFARIILDQTAIILASYDYNNNGRFQYDQIRDILIKIFGFDDNEVNFVLFQFFKYDVKQGGDLSLSSQEFLHLILSIFFIIIIFNRKNKSNNNKEWLQSRLNLAEFVGLCHSSCYFIRIRPSKEDLEWIFNELDTNKDGYISFRQYANFIRKYLGNNTDYCNLDEKEKVKQVLPPTNDSEQQLNFINVIWGQLKVYFDKYDKGSKGHLIESELKDFVIEVLKESSQRQLDYVFWNLFRVDNDVNKKVQFSEFAPFVLNHAGQISLQRFHREQIKGKSTLTEDQLFIVMKNAYGFLSTMPKSRPVCKIIFGKTQKNGVIKYGDFLMWVNRNLASKYKK